MSDTSLIKLSDYIVQFLAAKSLKYVFVVSGGASLHLIHSIAESSDIEYVCVHHEQSAAMAADGYSRVTNGLGVAISSSGPGATNLITGICCSFYDSVPLLIITGQVSTYRMVGDTGVRQIGFQETPIVDMCKKITKYCKQIDDPYQIRYELEKACHIACSERPGPVLLDIPDNLQRVMLDPSRLNKYDPIKIFNKKFPSYRECKDKIFALIKQSKRPVLVAGNGVHLSGMESEFIHLAETLNIPIALTWGASDIIPESHPLYIGTFGTHGMRHANFAIQNADLIISLGSRLDTKSTGSPPNTFSRGSKKIIFDIDPHELSKFSYFGLEIDLLIQEDISNLFSVIDFNEIKVLCKKSFDWLDIISKWKNEFTSFDRNHSVKHELDPYAFLRQLSSKLHDNTRIFVDTGCSVAWVMQGISFSSGQRIYHDNNNTAMGWALPASIGAYFAESLSPIICITGDGSLMMSLHELATIKKHSIPLKILLLNNSGYSMIKQTQEQWLDSKYCASSLEGGLSFPDYRLLALAFGLEYFEINCIENSPSVLDEIFNLQKSCLCNVIISADARVVPQVKFGRPNEDMDPLLPRQTFLENMIVAPLDRGLN